MVKRTGPMNKYLKELIIKLKKLAKANNAKIWEDVALKLAKPTRKRIEVNISKINRYANENDIIVVPGVVLGAGSLTKKVTVAAWRFTGRAKEKIVATGGKAISIEELTKTNPKGSRVRIFA